MFGGRLRLVIPAFGLGLAAAAVATATLVIGGDADPPARASSTAHGSPTPAAPGHPDDIIPVPTPRTLSKLERAIEFRRDLGLNTDPEYVARIEADPSASRELEIAMTPAEVQEVYARQERIAAFSGEMGAELERTPGFGGLYVQGRTIVVAVAGDTSAVAAVVDRYRPRGVPIELLPVAFGYADLRELQDRVGEESLARGVKVASVGVAVTENVVEMVVVDLTVRQKAELERQYGPRLRVVPGAAYACAGVGLHDMRLTLFPDGGVVGLPILEGELARAPAEPLTLLWPKGYAVMEDSAGLKLVRADGTTVARNGEVVSGLGTCDASYGKVVPVEEPPAEFRTPARP